MNNGNQELEDDLHRLGCHLEGAKMLGDWSTYFELKEISDSLSVHAEES